MNVRSNHALKKAVLQNYQNFTVILRSILSISTSATRYYYNAPAPNQKKILLLNKCINYY